MLDQASEYAAHGSGVFCLFLKNFDGVECQHASCLTFDIDFGMVGLEHIVVTEFTRVGIFF